MNFIFVEGETLKSCLSIASKELELGKDNVGYEILKENESLGIFTIKAWKKNEGLEDYGGFKIRVKSRGVEVFCPENEENYEEQYTRLDKLLYCSS